MNNSELCIPAAALSAESEDGQAMAPAQGDPVSVQIEGTVSRVEGGNVYITPQAANGQPIEGEKSMEDEDAEMDQDLANMGEYGGGGLLGILLLCALLLGGLSAGAAENLQEARARVCSGGAVSNYVAFANPSEVYSVEINNFTGSTLYLLVFDSSTNSLAGRVPHFTAVPIPTGSAGGKQWSTGAPFQFGVNACLSQTPFSLTNATSGGTVTVLHKGKLP